MNDDEGLFDQLLEEYRRERLGPGILRLVTDAVRTTATRYPASRYSETRVWDARAIEDLVQDVVHDRLLAERRIDYLFSTANTVTDLRRLLPLNVTIVLARRLRRSVADNVGDRLLDSVARSWSSAPGWLPPRWIASPDDLAREATSAELVDAARLAAVVPQQEVHRVEHRWPSLYDETGLQHLVAALAKALPGGVTRRELDHVLERVLTPWSLPRLEHEERSQDRIEPTTKVEALVIAGDLSRSILARLDERQQRLLCGLLCWRPLQELANDFGVSRTSIYKWRGDLFEQMKPTLSDLDDETAELTLNTLHTQVLHAVVDRQGSAQ
ncbi:MAG TPA: hypothetical protein VHB18_05190 [Mycobacteriales bacterium]|nr:hypothetical protein [Mycobacteriales bacterium]